MADTMKISEKILQQVRPEVEKKETVEKTVEQKLKEAKAQIKKLKEQNKQLTVERDALAEFIDKNVKTQSNS